MRISTEIGSIAQRVGREKAIAFCKEAGFDAFDLSMTAMTRYDAQQRCIITNSDDPLTGDGYLSYIRQLRRFADDIGIPCNQSHAPFPIENPLVYSYLQRAIECTAEMGASLCVIHPDNNKSPEENAEIYFRLLPFAKDHNVKIATENMWNWDLKEDHALPAACSHHDDFLAHIQAVNDPDFVACVDLGHAEMFGLNTNAAQMIRTLGHHVQALHIHDIDLHNDNHQIPFSLKMNYEPIIRALKDIGYQGDFTLEAAFYLAEAPELDTFTGVCNLAKAARRLADMFDAL